MAQPSHITPEAPGAGSPLSSASGPDAGAREPQSERELWTGRTSLMHFAGRMILWFVACAGLGALAWWLSSRAAKFSTSTAMIGWLVAAGVLTIVLVLPALIDVLGHGYRLTTQRLFITRGILSKTIDQTELVRVDDVRVRQSFVNRIFGLGSVYVLSTDMTDREVLIVGIRDPNSVAESIRAHMRVTRKSTLFVENV